MESYPPLTPLSGGAFRLESPAKINLTLRVLGRRPDGFHEIRTVFQEVSLSDILEFRPGTEWSLEIHGAELDPGPTNLISRAAMLLSRETGVPCHGRVVVHKRIPVSGGLGGGSSNASVTLIGLSILWNLRLTVEELAPMAAQLGSDCPFFLRGGLAYGEGRGDMVMFKPGAIGGLVVLVTPDFGVDTAWAYAASEFPLTGDDKSAIFDLCPNYEDQTMGSAFQFVNDLEYIVLKRYPELQWAKQRLLDLGGRVAMLSGSGSTMFGVYDDHARAAHAALQFEPPWKAYVCKAVGRVRAESSQP